MAVVVFHLLWGFIRFVVQVCCELEVPSFGISVSMCNRKDPKEIIKPYDVFLVDFVDEVEIN